MGKSRKWYLDIRKFQKDKLKIHHLLILKVCFKVLKVF